MSDGPRELSALLDALCDQRITQDELARLESLVLADRAVLRQYLRYVELHGLLHWDVAGGAADLAVDAVPALLPAGADSTETLFAESDSDSAIRPVSLPVSAGKRKRLTRRGGLLATATCLAVVFCGWIATVSLRHGDPAGANTPLAQPRTNVPSNTATDTVVTAPQTPVPAHSIRLSQAERHPSNPASPVPGTSDDAPRGIGGGAAAADDAAAPGDSIVSIINRELEKHWAEHAVRPSPPAADVEWVRRVHLDLIGRIPTIEEAEALLPMKKEGWRSALVDRLLASPEFARHSSVVWTNLLIGHTSPREVNRPALEKFLREQFHHNRPWSETVTRLIAAEGFDDEDGATNFLLAHVNNEAVPATAVTSRVLLCEQVQCTQCHNHPTGPWTQNRFWELNSFFQQTEIVRHRQTDPQTGRRLRDRLELVNLDVGGPTFYEDRQSRMKVAYPQLGGRTVDPSADVDRRAELARLLFAEDRPQLARAFVNRQWARFFGYGFTTPVDDMGPHTPVLMPRLLDQLTTAFVDSGYDVKQLIRWIVLSDGYQLASVATSQNSVDDPEKGQPPLFSRMYTRPMTAEQLFDSLLVATRADQAASRDWDEIEQRRRDWLEQFYQAIDNDENSEEGTFDGSLSQALVMMNGELVEKATDVRPGTVLHQVLAGSASDDERIRRLSLATLSRLPTPEENDSLKRIVRQQIQAHGRDVPGPAAVQTVYRDLMWAFLNSAEFRLIH